MFNLWDFSIKSIFSLQSFNAVADMRLHKTKRRWYNAYSCIGPTVSVFAGLGTPQGQLFLSVTRSRVTDHLVVSIRGLPI
jgi:DNA-binding GntR family transcriptional regulator